MKTKTTTSNRHSFNPHIVETLERPWQYRYRIYLIDLEIYTLTVSLNIHGYIVCKCRSHEVLSGTELMGNLTVSFFRDFCLNTILAGDGGICLIATTDDSSLANLFGIINRSLIM
jgi:hypothetical protein